MVKTLVFYVCNIAAYFGHCWLTVLSHSALPLLLGFAGLLVAAIDYESRRREWRKSRLPAIPPRRYWDEDADWS